MPLNVPNSNLLFFFKIYFLWTLLKGFTTKLTFTAFVHKKFYQSNLLLSDTLTLILSISYTFDELSIYLKSLGLKDDVQYHNMLSLGLD